VKVTVMGQFPPAASELPQVLVWPKSPGLAPVNPMLVMDRGAFPVLLRVTVWVALGVPTLLLKGLVVVTPAMGALPVPVRLMSCGLPLALSAMLTEAVRVKMAVGVNVTLIEQVLGAGAAGIVNPVQVSALLVKSPGLAPVNETLVMVKLELPVLVRVLLSAELVVPIF